MPRSYTELSCARPGVRPRLAAVAISVATLALAANAFAGVIDPAFERYLGTLPDEKQVSVIIMLAEQAPIAALDNQLRVESATLPDRHLQVINALREVADNTQAPLLADLGARKVTGQVGGFTPYWIANLVVAQMSVRAVRDVAARPDVGQVYANFTASLIEPVGRGREGDPNTPAAATPPGICAVNAKRVWYELGITGAGRLVCGLDTGVFGNHSALASRWRGTHVPWQEAWLDLLAGNTQFPADTNGHGTHTMGTMTGLSNATNDTVGVAWGAEWIACNAINQGVGPAFDNDVIQAFQWIADPDGNPNTTADVPDVVQNSWRINENFPGGYVDCDPRWWAVIDGAEAAGCAVVFSAGNEGPGAQTIGSPPDRITTPTNAYAIGAVTATTCLANPNTYTVVSFSSRGPSGCAGTPTEKIKPEVVAPGVQVRSSWNNGGYINLDGTSMAGPHVSGIFALLRQVNPNLDVTTMKQMIMDTAHDLAPAGEDNNSGWGMVDAYEAVLLALQTTGVANNHVPAADNKLRLLSVRPNPFTSPATVSYVMPSNARAALRVYDAQGRLVRTLSDGTENAGLHSVMFDGRDQSGRDLATGTYFLRIDADGQHASQKFNILR